MAKASAPRWAVSGTVSRYLIRRIWELAGTSTLTCSSSWAGVAVVLSDLAATAATGSDWASWRWLNMLSCWSTRDPGSKALVVIALTSTEAFDS